MFVHVSASFVAVITLSALGQDWSGVVDILMAMMPVYIALQGANYVKSGFENWKKISTSAPKEEESDEAVDG